MITLSEYFLFFSSIKFQPHLTAQTDCLQIHLSSLISSQLSFIHSPKWLIQTFFNSWSIEEVNETDRCMLNNHMKNQNDDIFHRILSSPPLYHNKLFFFRIRSSRSKQQTQTSNTTGVIFIHAFYDTAFWSHQMIND